MKVLVAGGAGYIGSHTVVELAAAGLEPVIVDNFVNSHREVLDRLRQIIGHKVPVYEVDVTDTEALIEVMKKERPEAVIHFAALKAVGESVAEPLRYYRNNMLATLGVCEAMKAQGVDKIIFSSSATVYGDPSSVPIAEAAPLAPTNPYGQTKMMSEQILRDAVVAQPGWSVVLLRYFNPVGAHSSGLIGEDPSGEPTNLVPYVSQVASGKLKKLGVFGDDYSTPDGTGVRDYLHVVDLARAHVMALDRGGKPGVKVYNLGTGQGYSVLEVVKAFSKASGRQVPYEVVGRRPGDIATCYADPTLAKRELGWQATKTLSDMCADSWHWQSQNPYGYEI